MSNIDDEILAMYNVGEGHVESEPEDDDQMPAAPPLPRARSNKRKQAPVDHDGFDPDLFYDEQDRAELMAKTQLEREMILTKRAEERANRKLRQELLATEAPAPPPGRRPDAKRQAIANIRKAQERKKSATTGKASQRVRDDDDAYLDTDEDEEEDRGSDEEYGAREEDDELGAAAGDHDAVDMAPAAYDDMLSIQVRRHKLEEWVTKPFFMTHLHNTVVRVSVPGSHSAGASGRQYLMAVVESVSEEEGKIKNIDGRMLSSPYPVSTGSKVTTNRWLHVRRGRHVRLCSLSLVSNAKVEEAEFEHWVRQCQRDDEGRLTHKDVSTAQDLLQQADSYTFSAQDVAELVEKKRQRGKFSGSVAAERMRLERLLAAAVERQDAEAQGRLEEQLSKLEEQERARQSKAGSKGKVLL